MTNNKVADKITGTELESPPETIPNKPKYVEIGVEKWIEIPKERYIPLEKWW